MGDSTRSNKGISKLSKEQAFKTQAVWIITTSGNTYSTIASHFMGLYSQATKVKRSSHGTGTRFNIYSSG